jgi:hypothetical protein
MMNNNQYLTLVVNLTTKEYFNISTINDDVLFNPIYKIIMNHLLKAHNVRLLDTDISYSRWSRTDKIIIAPKHLHSYILSSKSIYSSVTLYDDELQNKIQNKKAEKAEKVKKVEKVDNYGSNDNYIQICGSLLQTLSI